MIRRLLCKLNPWGHRWDTARCTDLVVLACRRCGERYDRVKHCRPRTRDAGAGR